LTRHGYRFDYNDTQDLYGDTGRKLVRIVSPDPIDPDEKDGHAGFALLLWYRMPSGRYEVIGYIT
jgi:hypothetical protein